MFTISKISTHARELNKEQHSTRYSKIIETLRLSSQSGSNLPEFLESEKAMRKAAIVRIKAEDQARRVAATEAHIALVNDALRRNR
ncbi:hypothetical protein CCP4SC76_490003 [Gammaproteobacteria bacterium]